ncbi:hypothetical protein KKG83_08170 [Candidatus Micrarchaeota archaeon]|nr:hypothetical protein [Candidatus Micrarchaeota archaeon]MBU2477417.1 hypothetical protein [Candidatus Micrarchaeota archaeon]
MPVKPFLRKLAKKIPVPNRMRRKYAFFDRRIEDRRKGQRPERQAPFELTKKEIFMQIPNGKKAVLKRRDYFDDPANAEKRKQINPEDKPFRSVESHEIISEEALSEPVTAPAKRGHYSVTTRVKVSTDRRRRERRKPEKKK